MGIKAKQIGLKLVIRMQEIFLVLIRVLYLPDIIQTGHAESSKSQGDPGAWNTFENFQGLLVRDGRNYQQNYGTHLQEKVWDGCTSLSQDSHS